MTDQQQKNTIVPGSQCLTPNLDRLCREGTFFSRAYTTNAICSPARASLMTGLLPHNHGMVDCTHTVDDYRANYRSDKNTLSMQLKSEGYSAGYFGKWHIERTMNLGNYGFDEYVTEKDLPRHTPKSIVKKTTVEQKGYGDTIVCAVSGEKEEDTEEYHIYSKAIDFIERASKKNEPWFTFVSTRGPHDPYIVPEEFYSLYDPKTIKQPESFHDRMKDKPGIYRRIKSVWDDLKWEDYQEITACYYAFCSLIDAQVGRILKALEKTGQADNTIVVYTTDHGDFMGAHGLLCKGVPAFEEVYNIPLVIKWPHSGLKNNTCDTYLNTHDLAPTLLEMAGCRPLEGIDGSSIVPYIKGEAGLPKRFAFSEFHGQRFFYTQRIIWEDGYKYVFNGFDEDEFYDLNKDPHELFNLIDDINYSRIIEGMASKMWGVVKESGDFNLEKSKYFMFRFAPVGPDGI